MSEQLKRIIESTTDLPSMPDVAFDVMRAVDSAESNAQSIANVLARDPSLAARVLRLANSAYYGMPKGVGSIREAIVILGMRTVKSLALVAATFPWLQKAMRGKGINPDHLWEHSLSTAFVARGIARATGTTNPELAFCSGVLHNLGIVILCSQKEADLVALAKLQSEPKDSFDSVEKASFGFDHAELGAALIELWNLPESFANAVRFHHNPDAADKDAVLADVLHIADHYVRTQGMHEGIGEIEFRFSENSLRRLGLEEETLDSICDSAMAEYRASSSMMKRAA